MSAQRAKQAAIAAFNHIVETHPNRVWGWLGNAGGETCVELTEQMIAYTKENYPELIVGYVYTNDYVHTFFYVTTSDLRTRIAFVSDPWSGPNSAKGLEIAFDGNIRTHEIPDTTGSPPYRFQQAA